MKVVKNISGFGIFILLLAGCSIPVGEGRLGISTDGINITTEDGEEVNVQLDREGDQITISGEDGAFSIGGEVDIPDNFPTDVPIPEDAEVFTGSVIEKDTNVAYTINKNTIEIDRLYSDYFYSNNIEIVMHTHVLNENSGRYTSNFEGADQDKIIRVSIEGGLNDNETLVFIGVQEMDDSNVKYN